MNSETIGRHLIIDGTSSRTCILNDEAQLARLLNEVIGLAGMEILVPAKMVRVELNPDKTTETGGDDGGVTGVAILSTSHVSIHTWPLTNRFAFDLYSCRDFQTIQIFNRLKERLGIVDAIVQSTARKTPKPGSGILWQ